MIIIICSNIFEVLSFTRKIKILKKIKTNSIKGIYGLYKVKKPCSNQILGDARYNNLKHKEVLEVLILFIGIGMKNIKKTLDFVLNCHLEKNNNFKNLSELLNNFNSKEINLIIVTGFSGSLTEKINIFKTVIIDKVSFVNLNNFNLKLFQKKDFENNIKNNIKLNNSSTCKNQIYENNLKNLFDFSTSLLSINKVIYSKNLKKILHFITSADIVDMETYWIAKKLSIVNIPQIYFRVISDDLNYNIPEFLNLFYEKKFFKKIINRDIACNDIAFSDIAFSDIAQSTININNTFYKIIRNIINYSFKSANLIYFIKFVKNIYTAQNILSKKLESIINDVV